MFFYPMRLSPMFISPLFYIKENVNSKINTTFVSNLPSDIIFPIVLGSSHSSINGDVKLLKPIYNNFCRVIIKILRKTRFFPFIDELPDTYNFIWRNSAFRKADQYIKKNNISYIHSFSIPFSSHLVALSLKHKYGMPWIAQFYEPWADNQFRGLNNYTKTKNEGWEKEVAAKADIIIHNSLKMCDSWLNKYGDLVANKLFYLPMPFKFKPIKNNVYNDNTFIISHIGNLYGKRRAEPFLSALYSFCIKYPNLVERLLVYFIGYIQDKDIELIKTLGLTNIVKVVGNISEEECEKYYECSNLFLVIEGEDQGPLFFPSKAVSYMYYNRPIMGITLKGSVLYDLLITNGHCAFSHSEKNDMIDYLHEIIINYEKYNEFNHNAWEEFEVNNVIVKYCEILRSNQLL